MELPKRTSKEYVELYKDIEALEKRINLIADLLMFNKQAKHYDYKYGLMVQNSIDVLNNCKSIVKDLVKEFEKAPALWIDLNRERLW